MIYFIRSRFRFVLFAWLDDRNICFPSDSYWVVHAQITHRIDDACEHNGSTKAQYSTLPCNPRIGSLVALIQRAQEMVQFRSGSVWPIMGWCRSEMSSCGSQKTQRERKKETLFLGRNSCRRATLLLFQLPRKGLGCLMDHAAICLLSHRCFVVVVVVV